MTPNRNLPPHSKRPCLVITPTTHAHTKAQTRCQAKAVVWREMQNACMCSQNRTSAGTACQKHIACRRIRSPPDPPPHRFSHNNHCAHAYNDTIARA